MPRLVSVAVPVPHLDLLTYSLADELDPPVPGARVVVPLGSRAMTGCVIRVLDAGEADGAGAPEGIKPLSDVLDAEAYLPAECLNLALWTSEYYACSPGEAIAAALPPMALVESRRVVELTEAGKARLAEQNPGDLSPLQRAAIDVLSGGRRCPVTTLRTRLARATKSPAPVPIAALVRSLERKGLVTTAQVLEGARAAYRTERVVALTARGQDAAARLTGAEEGSGLGTRQRELIAALANAKSGLTPADLRQRGLPVEGLRRLETRGLVTVVRRPVDRDPFSGPWGRDVSGAGRGGDGVELSQDQERCLDRLVELRGKGAFGVALVHGVTGSGKTEIYLRLAEHVIREGRRVLVLVPEIALTPAVATAFRRRFGERVAVQHSGLSDGERHDQWHRIRRGEVDVVVGTRSAVFAPLPRVGLIVVDEEHDGAYKQDDSPRYHGRDVAIVRGKHAGALVVLGSATPSMESYQHATAGRYVLLELDRRVLDRPLAEVQIVDMREEFAETGPDTILSRVLIERINARLDRREQVLLLLNRRGLSTAVFCRQCGGTVECPNCSVTLVVYGRGSATCHYCNYSQRVPQTCPTCGAPYLELMGYGTERVEREVTGAFPRARVARLDRDSARRKGAAADILGDFGQGRIDVLIGTQMIAKGHDFPRVTLVGVVSADVGLGLADFRAAERTFQLLTQVVGRAGRGEISGDAVIQTLHPEHYSIRHACRQDYRAFFAEETGYRKTMRYPPHVALINGLVRGPSFAAAMSDARDLVERILRLSPRPGAFQVLGPAPAPLARIKGEHRAQFFMKGLPQSRPVMRNAVLTALGERPELRRRVVIDVDPMSML